MIYDRKHFFDFIRPKLFRDRFSQSQVEGLDLLLHVWEEHFENTTPNARQALAYMLATAYHETAYTMQPIREYGKGKGREYGRKDPVTGHVYYGRGFVQITWKNNYLRAGNKLNRDFVRNPDEVMKPFYAAMILFRGCLEGWFTKHKIADFINDEVCDYVGARRIVNGTDRDKLIASYADVFEDALKEGNNDEMPVTDGKSMVSSTTNLATVAGSVTGTVAVVKEITDAVQEGATLLQTAPFIVMAIVIVAAALWVINERRKKRRLYGV